MDIFKENTIINKFDELEQALLLFSVQTKHIDEISENDCKLIASLLEELKLLRAREVQHYDTNNREFNTNIKYDYNTYVNAIQRAFNDGVKEGLKKSIRVLMLWNKYHYFDELDKEVLKELLLNQ